MLQFLLIAFAYLVSGKLGFSLAISPGNVTAIWPPSGIAFAAAYLLGRRSWLPIWCASFLLNSWFFSTSSSGLTPASCCAAAAIATGSTLQAALAGQLMRLISGVGEILKRPRDVLGFLTISAFCCAVAPTIGVASLCTLGAVDWSHYGYTWVTWWAGDTGGVLVYAPLILSWQTLPAFLRERRRIVLALACLGLLSAVSVFVFGDSPAGNRHLGIAFLIFLPLIWTAFCLGVSGVTVAVVIVELAAVCGTRSGWGPFAGPDLNQSLLMLEGFLGTVTLMGLTFSAVLSDWHATRESLESLAAQLEVRVKERTAELERVNSDLQTARDRAIEAFNLKTAFVANVSHELRTPLSGILGMSELALHENVDANVRAMLETINESGKILLTVVNDILDLSKMESGKVTIVYEPFNPAFLVQDCAKLVGPTAAGKQLKLNVSLDTQLPQFVYGDAARIRQVLLNLIGNAVKFTETGSISVAAEVDEDQAAVSIIRFVVSDTGIGIKEEDQNLLFVPFVQLDASAARRYGGTGLGLAISKRFVEMMKGTIGLKSRLGSGSTFWFRIPFDKSRPLPGPDEPEKTERTAIEQIDPALTANRLVLVVEDVSVLSELSIRQLAALGVKSRAVGDGGHAFEEFKSGQYDLILLDVNLPDMPGYEVTALIRAAEKADGIEPGCGIPIVALTAGAMEGDRERALAAGLDDYLAKPVEIKELRTTLTRWLARVERLHSR